MKVVVNTTPIISLAAINQLHVLEKLFGKIIIAEAVYQEIKAKEKNIISEIKPLLDEMIIKGRWYSTNVYQTFLERAGEL